MQEDCSVLTGPVQEDALFCHQYYSITNEPAIITGRIKITFLSLPGWHDVISPICRQLVTGLSALNVNSLVRLKYGWQVRVQSGHLHWYVFEGVLIHCRTRLIRVEKYTRGIICSLWTVTHMIVTALLTCYKLNCSKIVNFNRQQRTCVSRSKCTHNIVLFVYICALFTNWSYDNDTVSCIYLDTGSFYETLGHRFVKRWVKFSHALQCLGGLAVD